MEQGFYKYQDEQMLYAPNFVYNKNYTLLIQDKDTYDYPVEGWYLFNTREEAYTFFNVPIPAEEEQPQPPQGL